MADTEIPPQVTYEELAAIEMDFEDIDNQISTLLSSLYSPSSPDCYERLTNTNTTKKTVIKQYQLSKSAYARRSAAISKIPNFWPLVLEASPPELDSFVHPQDSKIFAESLTSIEITRPEIDSSASAPPKGEFKGHPRSFQITFTFSPNAYFSNSTLTKTFHYRRASDGWCNLVSEPVRIDWKNPEQDLSEGLTDAAYALFHARKNASTTSTTGGGGNDPISLSMQQKSLPEYSHLLTLLTSKNGHNTSFFTWFGFVSSRRWVSAEESEKAWEEFYGKLEAVRKGEKISLVAAKDGDKEDEDEDDENEEDDEEEEYGDQAVEVFENGDDVAAVLSEEIWPNAIKYFTQAQEMSESDGLSYDEDDDDEVESEDGEEEEVDMQALVAEANNKKTEKKKKRQSDVGFPSKKQKN